MRTFYLSTLCFANSEKPATCPDPIYVDATSSFDFDLLLQRNSAMVPVLVNEYNVSEALKYSESPGRLKLPVHDMSNNLVVYTLTIMIHERCPPGKWQIIYYGFSLENVASYRVSIETKVLQNWVR